MSSIAWLSPRVALGRWPHRGVNGARNLAERMGFSHDDCLLILSCDDFGSSQSANRAIERALRKGIASSATLMVPCPWAEAGAKECREFDIGVHLTLTSEYPTYRWRSLTGAPSLSDKDGYLPQTTHELWARADLSDVELECRAQIERALDWNVDVTHIDSHMDALQLDRHYFGVYMRLATRYRLPMRLRRSGLESPFSFISRSTIAQEKIVTTDRFEAPPWGEAVRPSLEKYIGRPVSGVTEFAFHPADDGEELRLYDSEYADLRATDVQCLMDENLKGLISSNGIKRIGFKALREEMRRAVKL